MERSLFATHHIHEETSKTIVIQWKLHQDLQYNGFPIFVVDDLTNGIQEEFISGSAHPQQIQEFHIPMVFLPGDTYKITSKVMLQKHKGVGFMRRFAGVTEFGRISTKFVKKTDEYDLYLLSKRAADFLMSRTQQNLAGDVAYFIRTKPKEYFQDLFKSASGMMYPAVKDDFGNRGCPINGELAGLTFAANNFAYEKPIHHGDMKLYIPADVMLNEHSNLYFADFYTADIVPYVNLVLTIKDSASDVFARKFLCPLQLRENPFLVCRGGGDSNKKARILVTENILVFVYYTEPINLHNVTSYGGALTTSLDNH